MSIPSRAPTIQDPPVEYSQDYMVGLIRALENAIAALNTIGVLTGTTLVLKGVPTSPYNLPAGSVYQEDGVLKLVLEGQYPFAPVAQAAGSIGTVTTNV